MRVAIIIIIKNKLQIMIEITNMLYHVQFKDKLIYLRRTLAQNARDSG